VDRRWRSSCGFAGPVHPHRQRTKPCWGEVGAPTNPTTPWRKAHSCGIETRAPQARPGLPGQRTYVTEIDLPPTDSGSTGSTRAGEMALPVVPVAYLRQLAGLLPALKAARMPPTQALWSL
jgi:hypothetical protein